MKKINQALPHNPVLLQLQQVFLTPLILFYFTTMSKIAQRRHHIILNRLELSIPRVYSGLQNLVCILYSTASVCILSFVASLSLCLLLCLLNYSICFFVRLLHNFMLANQLSYMSCSFQCRICSILASFKIASLFAIIF